MYGIFTYVWLIFMLNVGTYTIHGSYGISVTKSLQELQVVKRQKAEAVEKEVGNAIVCGKL